MGQKLMRGTLQAEAACQDSVVDMGQDESVLILIKHCRDMKRQETRLRLITLLLLLSCMVLFVLTACVDSRQRGNSGATGQESPDEQSPTYSKQASPADNPPSNSQRLQIHLMSTSTESESDQQYLSWVVTVPEQHNEDKYNPEKRAIVIPENGIYYVYVRIALKSHCVIGDPNFKSFSMKIHNWSKDYPVNRPMATAMDSIACDPDGFRTVFVGQLFHLLAGDHMMVLIEKGYKMISSSQFGAFLT